MKDPGNGLFSKVPATQTWGPEFRCPSHIKFRHRRTSLYIPGNRGVGHGSDGNKQVRGVHCLTILATLGITGLVSLPVSLKEESNRGRHTDTHYQSPHICASTNMPCTYKYQIYTYTKGKFKICIHICIYMYIYSTYIFTKEKVKR